MNARLKFIQKLCTGADLWQRCGVMKTNYAVVLLKGARSAGGGIMNNRLAAWLMVGILPLVASCAASRDSVVLGPVGP